MLDGASADDDFAGIVAERGTRVVAGYLRGDDPSNPHRSVKNLIEETSHEYGGRFLLELLQNAHDAHDPASGNGRVMMWLDRDEHEHGTLYVADQGLGFDHASFDSICKLAQSSKSVGEGIGNKGVGFKSVLQVCEWPEVYSLDPDDTGRDGFCFRFATESDLRELAPDEEALGRVQRDVSAYTVPVPVRIVPEPVRSLQGRGFRTVMRLPLRHAIAAEEVEKRFVELERNSAPVMLFLHRVSELRLLRRGGVGPSSDVTLSRDASELMSDDRLTAEVVTVDKAVRYLVVSRRVASTDLRAALVEATNAELLNQKWLDWEAPARIAAAVPLDSPVADHRLYTYLPMAPESTAPFPGHLHAPFYTDFARRGLVRDHPLNSMLFDAVAQLALDTSRALLEGALALPGSDARMAAIDLVSWTGPAVAHLARAAEYRELLLPIASGGSNALSGVRTWPRTDAKVLTPLLAERATGTSFLAPDVKGPRLQRLRETARALNEPFDLAPDDLAVAVEAAVRTCARDRLPITGWNALYDDLAVLFERRDDAARLAGRRILLLGNGELAACHEPAAEARGRRKKSAPTPFFPPVAQVTDGEDEVSPDIDLTLPAGLSDRVVFLHPELVWHDEGRKMTRARSWLQNNSLVNRFDARSLVEHVRSIVADSDSLTTHRDVLRFLYNLRRGSHRATPSAAGIRVLLPTAGAEHIVAQDVLFSSRWPGTHGELLESVTSVTAEVSAELNGMAERLLVPPRELADPDDDIDTWVAFLRELGVKDGLPVHEVRETRALYGSDLGRARLSENASVPPGTVEVWKPRLPEHCSARYPGTPYRTDDAIRWLPGQDRVDHLPPAAREAYAELVLIGLATWRPSYLKMVWGRDRPGDKDYRAVASPLGAFVSDARWLVVHGPRGHDNPYRAPRTTWHAKAHQDDVPRFVPLLHPTLRRLVNVSPDVARLLRSQGMPTWNDGQSAGRQLRLLTDLLGSDLVDPRFLPELRNTYRRTWNLLLGQADWEGQAAEAVHSLIVAVEGRDRVRDASDFTPESPLIITEHDDDVLLRQVVREFDYPELHLDEGADIAVTAFNEGSAVRPGQLGIGVLVDDREFTPTTEPPLLADELPWLVTVIVALLEHRTPPNERPGEARLVDIAAKLATIRVVVAENVAVHVFGRTRPVPAKLRGVLLVPDQRHPTLVFDRPLAGSCGMTWEMVDSAAEPVLRVVDSTRSVERLRLAVARLRQIAPSPVEILVDDDLVAACEIDASELVHTVNRLRTGITRTLAWLRPIVHCLWGHAACTSLPNEADDVTESAVLDAVRAVAVPGTLGPDEVVRLIQRAGDLDEVRRELHLPLAEFNETLAAVAPDLPTIDYGAQHEDGYRVIVHRADVRTRLLNGLRWALLSRFDATRPIENWTETRDLATLHPPEDWRRTRDTLTEDDVVADARATLEARVGTPLPVTGPPLEAVDQVRAANKAEAEHVLQEAAPLVRAWLQKRNEQTAMDVGDAVSRLAELGALDFRALTADQVLAWSHAVGIWPAEMPLTTDPELLGVTEGDRDRARTEEERQAEERRRAQRIVEVDGDEIDLGDGTDELRRMLRASLESTPAFLDTPNQLLRLADIGPARSAGRNQERTSGSGGSPRRPSREQSEAIGLAGEWLAYQWLLRRFPDLVTEESWVSSNRADYFTGSSGNDGLGYDFVVPLRSGVRMYEVKSTTGDGGEIRLGESEVRCAQEHARSNRWRLLVITHVLDRSRRIQQLPNPFWAGSRNLFTFAGQDIRLRYVPAV